MLKKLLDSVHKDNIGEPPWEYDFLINLDMHEYPKYLKKILKYRTGEDLPLKSTKQTYFDFLIKKQNTENFVIDKNKLKTFNQKIQWLKLYDNSKLKTICTDKLLMRNYVKNLIGEGYLRSVLQIIPSINEENSGNEKMNNITQYDVSKYFEQIDFEKLPDSFVIKCNHGCKWHYIIGNKNDFLQNKRLVETAKRRMTGWLEQEFWPWEGFEMNYQGIKPMLFIEPFMKEERLIEIYCFNGESKIIADIRLKDGIKICIYNENFTVSDLVLKDEDKKYITALEADSIVKEAKNLSNILAANNNEPFKFVRVDWMVYNNKLHFEEMTFTPYSGFTNFGKKWNLKMGEWIKL